MLRFAKEDGTPFNLDWDGDIYVFSSDGVAIAKCEQSKDHNHPLHAGYADPYDWDCWEILYNNNSLTNIFLQRAIASAYNAISLVERMADNHKFNDEQTDEEWDDEIPF